MFSPDFFAFLVVDCAVRFVAVVVHYHFALQEVGLFEGDGVVVVGVGLVGEVHVVGFFGHVELIPVGAVVLFAAVGYGAGDDVSWMDKGWES